MGMHRSGTTLVARALSTMGLFAGADCNVHHESAFFHELNKEIFRAGHAEWDYPLALLPVLDDTALCDALEAMLTERCASAATRGYLGWWRWLRARSLAGSTQPWGWKDPRNTCTLPLWLRIFPEARVVNVYRNGVDVAASLVERERKRRGRIHNAARSSRCLDPHRAFELWAEYVEISLRVTEPLPPRRVRDIRYEALVEKPEETLRQLADFAGVAAAPAALKEAAEGVERSRALAFRRDPERLAFYREKAGHPLMQRLEYGDLS